MDNLTEQELKAVFDVVNVYEPEDISHVYPEMASDEFMQDVNSAWKKLHKMLSDDNFEIITHGDKKLKEMLDNTEQNWENIIMHEKVQQPVSSYTEFEKLAWVSDKAIPAVGSEVDVKINGIGRSKVLKYFVEYGFIGMLVQPFDPPAWYIKQNGADQPCHVYPAETLELHRSTS